MSSISGVRNSHCNLCKTLSDNAETVCLVGAGPTNADIMFVGEAPGAEEDSVGKPFVGAAGRFFNKHMLRAAGIDRDEIYITNAVKCRPPNNKTPTIVEIRKCRRYLEEEIAIVKPKVIVLLGNAALHSVIAVKGGAAPQDGKGSKGAVSGITKWRGKLMWHREFSCYVVATFHPSGLMRKFQFGLRYDLDLAIEDLELAQRAVSKRVVDMVEPKIYFADTKDKAVRVLQGVQKSAVVAFDIETTGLSEHDTFVGFSVSDREDRGFFVDASLLNYKEVDKSFREFLSNNNILKVLHNVEFDERYLRMNGYSFSKNYVDTMVAAALLDENFTKGLKDLTWRYLPFGGYDLQMAETLKSIGGWKNLTAEVAWQYGAMDSVVTYQLWQLFKPRLKEQELYPLYKKILMPVREVMTSTEVYGFAVDVDQAEHLRDECTIASEFLKKKIMKFVGYSVNLRSPKQLAGVLFGKLKAKPLRKTKTGYSCDGNTLEWIRDNVKGRQPKKAVQFVSVLLKMRYLENQLSKFIKPIIKYGESGIVHTKYNITGTVTGRTSRSDPGIHNIPRDAAIRTLFVARKGHSLIHADLDRAEMTVLNAYCQDEKLSKILQGDPHSEVYKLMLKKPDDYVPTEDERFIGKAINFGLLYGRGAASLASALKCSVEEAQDYIDAYFAELTEVKRFLKDNVEFAKKHRYVKSLFGRRRHLPQIVSDDTKISSKAERQANNSLIQSTSADYTYIGLIRTDKEIRKRAIPDTHIVHTVHDCIVVDTPDKYVEEVAEIVKDSLEKPVKGIPIKLTVGIDIVKKWGEGNDSKLTELLNYIQKIMKKEKKR